MARRRFQSEHDRVVQASAETYTKKIAEGFRVSTNPGSEHNVYLGSESDPRYPDVVVWKPQSPGGETGSTQIIEEIETADSVTEAEADQWVDYGRLFSGTFFLIVPRGVERQALAIVQRKKARVSQIYSYAMAGQSISFENTKLL